MIGCVYSQYIWQTCGQIQCFQMSYPLSTWIKNSNQHAGSKKTIYTLLYYAHWSLQECSSFKIPILDARVWCPRWSSISMIFTTLGCFWQKISTKGNLKLYSWYFASQRRYYVLPTAYFSNLIEYFVQVVIWVSDKTCLNSKIGMTSDN